jgi:diguanylate cyclase (GGDEF)-like protein
MSNELFLTALIVQCSATLFLFAVFLILYRHWRQPYFGYWTAAWFSMGTGLAALQAHVLAENPERTWPLVGIYHASLSVTALLAFFARYAFQHGRPVARRAGLLFLPVCIQVAVSAPSAAEPYPSTNLPGHVFLAVSLWALGSAFWRHGRAEHRHGTWFLAGSFGLWGLQQVHYVAASLFLQDAGYLKWMGFVDTALVMFVALGMIVFSLHEDRSRLVESNRKLELSEERLKDLVARDPLTGLFNRRHFDHVVPQLEAQARRLRFPVTLFVIDLNNFKATNDREGHHRGDQILAAVADFLRRETRASDLAFRWGGDEFLLLMTDLSAANAEEKARELHSRWEIVRAEVGTDVTLALGWAPLLAHGVESALRLADRRMYGDKHALRIHSAQASPAGTPPAAPEVVDVTDVPAQPVMTTIREVSA